MAMTRKRLLRIGFYGTSGMIFLLVLLDPYSRQSILGPKVQGEPLCYWQGRIRRGADPSGYQPSIVQKALAFLGIRSLPDDAFQLNRGNELPVFLSLMADPSTEVRAAVARGLGFHRESVEATDALVRLLDDPAPQVRAAAAYACLCPGPSLDAALPRLRQLMDDENALCRTCAASLVCRATDPRDKRAYSVLLAGLQAPDVYARVEAIRGLCDLAKDFPESFEKLREAAAQDPVVRLAVAGNAGKFGPVAAPLLVEYLRDPAVNVRHSAAWSVGEMGPDAKAAVPALVQALVDPRGGERSDVRAALSKIDPERYPEKKSYRQP